MTSIFFLFISVVTFSYFLYGLIEMGLSVLSSRRRETRIGEWIRGEAAELPMQALLRYAQRWTKAIGKHELLDRYIGLLESLLRRADLIKVKASDILGYQMLFAGGASLLFGSMAESFQLASLTFLMGSVLPVFYLRDKALRREKDILRELPNALEIIALCSEAGLSVEQGMEQYVLNAKRNPLRDELSHVLEQAKAGASRKEALNATTKKLDLGDFTFFTTSLVQAERFGTGVSKTLRQLSLTIRDKQAQRAEKAIQELPVKLLFPLILFIMPVTFLIIFGPVLLRLMHP